MTSRGAETFKVPVKGEGPTTIKGALRSPHTHLGGGVCQNNYALLYMRQF